MPTSKHAHPSLLIFVAMFFGGVALLSFCMMAAAVEERKTPDMGTLIVIGEHLASAVIVAACMGMTYEWFIHGHMMDSFQQLLLNHQREIGTALDQQESAFAEVIESVRATNAQEVFTVLRDIAERRPGTPTLYYPAREAGTEFVFSTHLPFFQRLITARDGRDQTIAALREWIDPSSSLSLRFLGSDFIGLLRLHELVSDLRDVVKKTASEWHKLEVPDKCCALNYIWAASRCESPMYMQLASLLLDSDDEFVLNWILFVPQQMPDERLADIIREFMAARADSLSCDVLKNAVAAIGALHRASIHMEDVIQLHAAAIEKCKLTELAKREMAALPIAPVSRGLMGWLKS
jgi:hypothetical protein